MSDATYEKALPDSFPTTLRGRWGRAWGAAHGVAMDAVLAAVKAAVKMGFIVGAGTDTHPYHLADAGLEGLPGESADDVVTRVRTAFDVWRLAGTRLGVELALAQLGFTGYTLRTTRDWLPDGPPDGRMDLWARYWVLAFSHTWSPDGTWGDAGTWDDGGTWDSDATVAEVTRVTRFLRRQSNARDLGYVRLYFGAVDTDVWGPDEPWDHGTWDDDTVTFIDWRIP